MDGVKPLILRSRMGREFATGVYERLAQEHPGMFEIGEVDLSFHGNREPYVKVLPNVARRRVYVVHAFEGYGSPGAPMDNYDPSVGTTALMLVHDALVRASADRITDVLPHMPWQRSDRKDEGRVPIAAALMMQAMVAAGGGAHERIITAEMHSGQQQGFVQGPVDNLYTNALFADHFRALGGEWDVAAADVGGMKRARNLGARLGANVLLAEKQKEGVEKRGVTVYGEPQSRRVVIPDDLIDTGKTLCLVAEALRKKGAEEVYACATHALFTEKEGVRAEQRLQDAGVKVVVTDSVPTSAEYREANAGWLTVLSVAPLFAQAVHLRETGGSISALFDG